MYVFSCIQIEYRKIRTRKNSVFRYFSRSARKSLYILHKNHSRYGRSIRTSSKFHSTQANTKIIRRTPIQQRRKKTTSFTYKTSVVWEHQHIRYSEKRAHEFKKVNWDTLTKVSESQQNLYIEDESGMNNIKTVIQTEKENQFATVYNNIKSNTKDKRN